MLINKIDKVNQENSSRLNYDIILNNMTESMIVLNLSDEVVFFNSVAASLQELLKIHIYIGCPFRDIVSANRKEFVIFLLQQVKSTRKPQTSEAEYKDASGGSHFFEIVYNPVLDEKKELINICIVSREITHQKIFEKRATQLMRDLSDFIVNANAIIFGIDSRGYMTEWNNECVRLSRFHKNEVLTQKVQTFIEGSTIEFEGILERTIAGVTMNNYELLMKTRHGELLTILSNATIRRNSEGNVIGALFVGHDITELIKYRKSLEMQVRDRTRKLQEALLKEKELVDIRNRFISIASHEFRIPLSSIESSSAFLKSNPDLQRKSIEKLDNIEKQVNHMKVLLEDVLTLEKSELTKLTVNFKKMDLVSLLNTLIEEVQVNTNYSHAVQTAFSTTSLEIESDEKLIRNIFLNLLSNAIKFSPDKKSVFVMVNERANDVEIIVKDNGIGIHESEIKKIADPFYRASNASDIKGTGLGLSIVKKAVDSLGGSFNIESIQGEGTMVAVTFNKH